MLLAVAALAGFGGGNFASSMTNINAFYPQREKGWALGLNAGGGNIGVPVIQLIGLLVIATVGNTAPEIVCAVYLVLIAVAAVGAAVHTVKADMFRVLQAEEIGMQLTESYAMYPGAAVSGFYFSHPESKYFVVGKINDDQVEDMAQRRGMDKTELERHLAPNLS